MNYLTRVLKALFLARRLYSTPVEFSEAAPATPRSTPQAVESPPPKPAELEDDMGGYDPLLEREVIMTPLSEDPIFYNLYCAQAAAEILYRKAEFFLHDLNYFDLPFLGVEAEGGLIVNWVRAADPAFYHFRLFRIHGHFVVAAQHINNDSQDWYYCTSLELPQGIFNPILATFSRPAKQAAIKKLEELLDRSRSSGDQP